MTAAKKKSRSFATSLRTLYRKLWWFDVVYPMTLALILFASLTHIIYAGQRQGRLAIKAETRLLEFSLRRAAGTAAVNRDEILIVTSRPAALPAESLAPHGANPDASAAIWAQAVRKLGHAGVPLIFLYWDTDNHPSDPAYIAPLVEVLTELGSRVRLYLAVPPEAIDSIPAALTELAVPVDMSACDELPNVQKECTYNRKWSDWVIQTVLNELGEFAKPTDLWQPWISSELSSSMPQYILNLPDPGSLPEVDLNSLVAENQLNLRKTPRAAFLGPDLSGSMRAKNKPSAPRLVLTVYDDAGSNVDSEGTALHRFWAMIGSMYLDQRMVSVPPFWAIITITSLFCVLITLVMAVWGGPLALGMFLVYAAAGPFINALTLRYLKIYLPLFDSYYFGLTTFIVAGMGRLSYTAYSRWKLDAQRELHAEIADLKGNFISLFSHNLNTPVAKMQGMLALLAQSATDDKVRASIAESERRVAQLEYAIRCVLIASALEEGAVNETPRSITALSEEIRSTVTASLRRLGVLLKVFDAAAEESDLLLWPIPVDVRALVTSVGSLAALFGGPGKPAEVFAQVSASLDDAGDPVLTVHLTCRERQPAPEISELLTGPGLRSLRVLGSAPFVEGVMAGLAQIFANTYQGALVLVSEGRGASFTLTIKSRSPS